MIVKAGMSKAAAPAAAWPEVSFPGRGVVRLRQPELFAEPGSDTCRGFLNRTFALACVQHVRIHPAQGTAEIRYTPEEPAAPVLRRLSEALRGAQATVARLADRLSLDRSRPQPVQVFRYQAVLSTWQVLHELPGRLRLRHDELYRRPQTARLLERELPTVFGVRKVSASSRTGTVLIHYDRPLTPTQLLHVLENLLADGGSSRPRGYQHQATNPAVSHATLGLAAAADFALPLLAPASAGVLVALNLQNIRTAGREVLTLRPGLATLYTAIVAVTLANGAFFSAALMLWLMQYWDRRYHRQLESAQADLLAPARCRSRFVWLCRDETLIETPLERIRPGDVLAVRAGEPIPTDGIVTAGAGQVDERLLLGDGPPVHRQVGDAVQAGTLLVEGALRFRVEKIGEGTRAAALGRLLENATTPAPAPLKVRGEPFARQAVPITLATAGVGLATGNLNTALAILRADYATGPGMTAPLGIVEDVSHAWQAGLLVRRPDVFRRVAETNVLVLDFDAAWLGKDLASLVRDLRQHGQLDIGIVSARPRADLEPLVQQAELDFAWYALPSAARAQVVRHYQDQGRRVAFVGDCRQHREAAQLAHATISLGDLTAHDEDQADVFLLRPDVERLPLLWQQARRQAQRQRMHVACTVLPNLFCVAGAFTLGFNSLHTVLLTNLGTATVFRSSSRWLREPPLARPGPELATKR